MCYILEDCYGACSKLTCKHVKIRSEINHPKQRNDFQCGMHDTEEALRGKKGKLHPHLTTSSLNRANSRFIWEKKGFTRFCFWANNPARLLLLHSQPLFPVFELTENDIDELNFFISSPAFSKYSIKGSGYMTWKKHRHKNSIDPIQSTNNLLY